MVPAKMGRQTSAALGSPGFAIFTGPFRSPRKSAAGEDCLPRLAHLPAPCRFGRATGSTSKPERGSGSAHAVALPDPFHGDCPGLHPAFRNPTARLPRSGQLQPGALVFGQLFGPPLGGSLEPLCAPPTIWDNSFSSRVRRVSLDNASFLCPFFMKHLLSRYQGDPTSNKSNKRGNKNDLKITEPDCVSAN